MRFEDAVIKSALLGGNYVSAEDVAKAETSAKQLGGGILDFFFSRGILTKDLVGQALAESFGVPYADLNSNLPPKEQVLIIPEEIAKELRVVLFAGDKKNPVIATDNPEQKGLTAALRKVFPRGKINISFSLPEDIDTVFVSYQKSLETRFSKILEEKKRVAPELLDEIFDDAITYNASDIHFEPRKIEAVVRFRVDGVLQEAGRIPKDVYENIINRIKVQSHLRIDEHFAAQDGSIHYEKDGHAIDMRTSIVPTVDGEKIVLRVLAAYLSGFTLADLGLSDSDQKIFNAGAAKPFGMILVTGPTGSGKTTTLYSLLKMLNNPEDNITTIEDPVEYRMPGVNQIQVNLRTDLTFAKGLRSIVRQDPDIILVGEIRDPETAEIAVNAALTGHLLLSTFHANDAATAIPRLLDMDIEPFLLASTLELVVAQRLARRICEHCRYGITDTKKELTRLNGAVSTYFPEKNLTLYKGKGCDLCNQTGYKGRVAVFELIQMTQDLQDVILRHPSAKEIWAVARSHGARSMFEDGVEKVKNGVTTLEELLRVAIPPSAQV
jgi:type IV pilus assembly protein PilB